MPFFMNPWVILGALVALVSAFGYGHHVGWGSRDQEAQIEVAKANEKARAQEHVLAQTITDQATQLRKATNEITRRQTDLNRLAADGRLRLPAASCVQAPAGATAAGGNRNEAPGELERQTIEALIAIAADGDRAAEQAGACIDAYNKVREQLNAITSKE